MKPIDPYQEKLDVARVGLSQTEEWEFIPDDKTLKLNSPKYKSYRRSASYKLLRELRLEIDDNKCVKCGSNCNLQFHHLTYERLFRELLSDGITLCADCHQKGHDVRRSVFNKEHKTMSRRVRNLTPKRITSAQQQKSLRANRPLCACWIHEYVTYQASNTHDGSVGYVTTTIDKIVASKLGSTYQVVESIRSKCGLVHALLCNKGDKPILGIRRLLKCLQFVPAAQLDQAINEKIDDALANEAGVPARRSTKPDVALPRTHFPSSVQEMNQPQQSGVTTRTSAPNSEDIELALLLAKRNPNLTTPDILKVLGDTRIS